MWIHRLTLNKHLLNFSRVLAMQKQIQFCPQGVCGPGQGGENWHKQCDGHCFLFYVQSQGSFGERDIYSACGDLGALQTRGAT